MNPALEQAMTTLKKDAAFKSEIVRDPSVMSGEPVVCGTRIPAMTIVAYLSAGHSAHEIFADYPTLPLDGIEAVKLWSERTAGADWSKP
jgi:uncharacterized protein (DUF433 family)